MNVLMAFGGLHRRGGITPDVRNLERGLAALGVSVVTEASLGGVLRRLRADEVDVVHTFGCLPSATIFGTIAAGRATGKAVVWTPVFHPARLRYWVGSGRHRPMKLFDTIATRACRSTDAVVGATDAEVGYFAGLGAPRVELNPPVIERTSAALRGTARAAARRDLGVGDEPLILMIAAHSARRKGTSFAHDAFVELRRAVPDATLLLVGGGDPAELARLEGVRVTGWCPDEQLEAAYGCADVLFVPSRYEQFSRVTLEGWAHELPVVVSDGVALAPLADGRAGRVVRFGDASAAASALRAILDDPALARGYGLTGRELAETRFSLGSHAARMAALYEELCVSRAPARRAFA